MTNKNLNFLNIPDGEKSHQTLCMIKQTIVKHTTHLYDTYQMLKFTHLTNNKYTVYMNMFVNPINWLPSLKRRLKIHTNQHSFWLIIIYDNKMPTYKKYPQNKSHLIKTQANTKNILTTQLYMFYK